MFLLYEPLFVSLFGASIGHMFLDLRVKKETDNSKNIYFHIAILRFIVKSVLGWVSFFTVNSDDKKRAIHDHLAKSVVLSVKKKIS